MEAATEIPISCNSKESSMFSQECVMFVQQIVRFRNGGGVLGL
jgi:hypothetical protein